MWRTIARFSGSIPAAAGFWSTLSLERELRSDRVHRAERVSANRWHNELILKDPSELDAELLSWIREGYDLTA